MADPDEDSEPLASLVEDLRDGAELVARGELRIDASGAAARARYLLASPHDWLLPLVAAVVVSGGRFLRVRETWRGLEATFDSPAPDDGALRALAAGIPAGGAPGERALRHLAIALHAARTLQPASLSLDTAAGLRLDLVGRSVGAAPARDAHRLHFRPASRWRGVLRVLGRRDPATRALWHRAAFAPPEIEIVLDGRRVNGPIDLAPCGATAVLTGPSSTLLPALGAADGAIVQRAGEAPVSAVIGVSGKWYERGWLGTQGSSAAFVRDGVAVVAEGVDLGHHNVRAIVTDPRVKFDATWGQVVRDEDFEAVLEALRREVRVLRRELVERWQPGTGSAPVWIYTHAVEEHDRHLRRAGRLAETVPLREKLARQFDARLRSSDDYGGDATRALASLLARLGRDPEAREMLERLRKLRRGEWRSVSDEDAHSDLAALDLDGGRWESAQTQIRRASRRFWRNYDPKVELVDSALEFLSLAIESRLALGQPVEQEIGRARAALAKNPPAHLSSMLAAARFFLCAGMPSEAGPWAARALEVLAEPHRGKPPRGSALALAAAAAFGRGELVEAFDLARQAREDVAADLGPEHPEIAGVLALTAAIADGLGNAAEARTCMAAALDIVGDRFGPDHREAVFLHELAASLEARRGRPHAAFERLQGLSDTARRLPRLEWGASLLRKSGQDSEAVALLGEAVRDGPDFPPFHAALTLSHAELWTGYTLPGLAHRPVRLRLPVCDMSALARSAELAAADLERAGRTSEACRARARLEKLSGWRDLATTPWPLPA